jgi:hypothetical protein
MATLYEGRAQDAWSSSERPSGLRGALDVAMQSCLVDLFAAYGIALAPSPRTVLGRPPSIPDMSATVGFMQVTTRKSGRVTLSLPTAVVEAMKGGTAPHLHGDWVRELTSQLLGRFKGRMLQFGVRLEIGISSTIDSKVLANQLQEAAEMRLYGGRTLRGDILASLAGVPADHQLKYQAPAPVPAEGSTILF